MLSAFTSRSFLKPGPQLLEDGLVQGNRAGLVFRPDGQIEDLGLAELGPFRRGELDVLAELDHVAVGGESGRAFSPVFAKHGRPAPWAAGPTSWSAAASTLRLRTTSRIVSWTVFISSG